MQDISIIELGFYGFIELLSLSMLIISILKEIPDSQKHTVLRAIFLVPGMIAAGILAGSGPNIIMQSITTNGTAIMNLTSVTNTTSHQLGVIHLQIPMWGMFHMMIFLVLFVFILFRTISMLEKRD